MKPLIIDTDIGSDVDDALALIYAAHAALDIKLISTVHGNTKKRGRVAKSLCDMLELDVCVVAGEEKPIRQHHLYWYGDEGQGFLNGKTNYKIQANGVEKIAQTISDNPGIEICAIGPLTNIAKVLEDYPETKNKIGHIYMMGNAITTQKRMFLNYRSHNFKVDPEAVDLVFHSNIPKTIITTKVAKENSLTKEDFRKLATSKKPWGKPLREAATYWMDKVAYDVAYLYDPLTLAHSLYRNLTRKRIFKETSVTTSAKRDFRKHFLKTIQ